MRASIGLLLAWVAAVGCTRPRERVECLAFEPDTVTVQGELTRLSFAGAPNFSDTLAGDAVEAGLYLRLNAPLCAHGGSWQDAVRDAQLVQLVLDSVAAETLGARTGQRVALRGELFPAHTGHHHAPVLLQPVP